MSLSTSSTISQFSDYDCETSYEDEIEALYMKRFSFSDIKESQPDSIKSWAFNKITKLSLPLADALKDRIQSYDSPVVEGCIRLIAGQTAKLAYKNRSSNLLWISEAILDLIVLDDDYLNPKKSEYYSDLKRTKFNPYNEEDYQPIHQAKPLLSFDVTVTDCPEEDDNCSTNPVLSTDSSHSLSYSNLDLSMEFRSSPIPTDPHSQLTRGTYQKWQLGIEAYLLHQKISLKLNLPTSSLLSLPARVGLCRDMYKSMTSSFSLKLALAYRHRPCR